MGKDLVIGAGLTGVVLAERIVREKCKDVLVVEKNSFVGGNCYDYPDAETGTLIHKYGPHIFHTSDKGVWDYLSRFTKWHPYYLRVRSSVDGSIVPLPFNLTAIHRLFPSSLASKLEQKLVEKVGFNKTISILDLRAMEDRDMAFLADYVYNKVFLPYYLKQWGFRPEELDPAVAARVPVLVGFDDRYFRDVYQGIPREGYTAMVLRILDNDRIETRLNTDYHDLDLSKFDHVFCTAPIDEYFDFCLGELPYRSLSFDVRREKVERIQDVAVVSYPCNYDFTRICEHKHFLPDATNSTVFSLEYPAAFVRGVNERYYPIPRQENWDLYARYLELAGKHPQLTFAGRLGDYKYYNMDQAVKRALELPL